MASNDALRLPYECSSPTGRRHSVVTTRAKSVISGSPYRADCPTRHILDRIGDRWTVLIVGALSDRNARFSELRRRIEGVSQKMLTEAGRTLREPLRALEEWSIAHLGDVSASQQAYDRRGSTS